MGEKYVTWDSLMCSRKWLKQDITSPVCDVILSGEHLFILALLCAPRYHFYDVINALFYAHLCVESIQFKYLFHCPVLTTISCFFVLEELYERWVHVLHMCGPSAQGTYPRIPDTRVQAEAVVQCRVDKQCSHWPLLTHSTSKQHQAKYFAGRCRKRKHK